MSVCRLPVLLTVAALLVHPAWQQQINSTQTPTLTCDAAIDAAFFAARALAAARNVSGIGLTAQSLGRNITSPSAQFVTVLQRSLQQFLDLTANRSTNTVNFFSTSPYSGWGSRMAQTAVGMSTHVPAATLGEIAYIANTLQRNLSNTPAYDPTQVSSSWFRAWDAFAASLRKQASNSTDLYSQRSMLLRAVVYAATGLMPMLPTDAYQQEREQVAQDFEQALPLFDAYEFTPINVTNTAGNTTATYEALLVTPTADNLPLMVIYGSPYNWLEPAFLRYGLGALRRGYAVVMMRQPGQAGELSRAPHQPLVWDYTNMTTTVLDTISRDPTLNSKVNTSDVTIMGVSLATFGAANACAGLGSRVRACVLNAAVFSLGSIISNTTPRYMFQPVVMALNAAPELVPNAQVAAALSNTTALTSVLLRNCTEDTAAPEALAALLTARGFDPDFVLTMMMIKGGQYNTLSDVAGATWSSLRALGNIPPVNVSAITVPVLVVGSAEDANFGGQEAAFIQQLRGPNATRSKSVVFAPETGGAAALQVGANVLYEQVVYPWLSGLDSA